MPRAVCAHVSGPRACERSVSLSVELRYRYSDCAHTLTPQVQLPLSL